jgi:DNA-binding PadR family transcriptional regulator
MKQSLKTPLALAILNLLGERPMHPYEMQQHMRERGHDYVIKLKGGSLYSTINRLIEGGLIQPVETSREGKRPERTTYALTDEGRDGLVLWMEDLLATPMQEFPWFGAVLAFVAALSADDVIRMLEHRLMALEKDVAAGESVIQGMSRRGMPRLFGVEAEYGLAMTKAESEWVRAIIADIRSGQLPWPQWDKPPFTGPYEEPLAWNNQSKSEGEQP